MDRTREFQTIVRATEIPQPEPNAVDFYTELYDVHAKIQSLLADLERLTSYEAFRMQPLLTKGYELVRAYRAVRIPAAAPGTPGDVLAALRSMATGNALRATLRLNEASRRCDTHGPAQERPAQQSGVPSLGEEGQAGVPRTEMSSGQVALQEMAHEQFSEVVQERRRIVKSISEIGQIVEDISIHVSLQEEQLKRIDDAMVRTEKWNKKALAELRETWAMAGENRGQMCRFFGVWLAIFIIFWFVKR